MKIVHSTEALLAIPFAEVERLIVPYLTETSPDSALSPAREITKTPDSAGAFEIISRVGNDRTTYSLTAIGKANTLLQARAVWETDPNLTLTQEEQEEAAEIAFHVWEADFESYCLVNRGRAL